MSLRSPLFFLLVDSWLGFAGAAGVVASDAGCVVLESVAATAGVSVVAAGESVEAAGAASVAAAAGGAGRALGLPGVIVSTVALLPMLEEGATMAFGCNPKPMVSSPVSLAGVMVGAP